MKCHFDKQTYSPTVPSKSWPAYNAFVHICVKVIFKILSLNLVMEWLQRLKIVINLISV